MENTVPFYRIYLSDPIRKYLRINLKHTQVYVFKHKHYTYLSTDVIPKDANFSLCSAKLGLYQWCLDIPKHLLEYEPDKDKHTVIMSEHRIIKINKKHNKWT